MLGPCLDELDLLLDFSLERFLIFLLCGLGVSLGQLWNRFYKVWDNYEVYVGEVSHFVFV